jgi:glycosyltransferase involved in cell wall biosynthesis
MAANGADLREDPINLSVVMPVHAGADVGHLDRALTSVFDQTQPADEVLVVEDGPLTPAHDQLLSSLSTAHPSLRRIRLSRSGGVAVAVQAGVEAAQSAWIARMDSDDVALPHRFASQLEAVHSGRYDVIGSAMVEMGEHEDVSLGVRRMPENHEDIARLLRRSNPLNHPTVVFRRSLVLRVGGYQPLPHLEDYDLWARIWAAGGVLHNLTEPLVLFRGGDAMLSRRRQRGVHRAEWQLQQNLRSYGLISRPQMLQNLVARTAFRMLPKPLLRYAYRRLFHER